MAAFFGRRWRGLGMGDSTWFTRGKRAFWTFRVVCGRGFSDRQCQTAQPESTPMNKQIQTGQHAIIAFAALHLPMACADQPQAEEDDRRCRRRNASRREENVQTPSISHAAQIEEQAS
jgi:hypothetical protein